jgi:hypothetical protein
MAIIPADEKVFMVDKRTNTTYGGSQALQDMQQWYTMQDVSDSVENIILPYKVFTALLTQSGGNDPTFINGSYLLTVGVSYTITDDGGSYELGDFTNVGAPNNELGTTFIATGTTPNSWGDNIILTYNNGTPVATVLENTIGNIWFEFNDGGVYDIRSESLFIDKKTGIIMAAPYDSLNPNTLGLYKTTIDSEDLIKLRVFNVNEDPKNGYLNYTFVEIKVYN